jgi:hypothetical protein
MKVAVRFSQRNPHHAPRAEMYEHKTGWWKPVSFFTAIKWIKDGHAERLLETHDLYESHYNYESQRRVNSLVDAELIK